MSVYMAGGPLPRCAVVATVMRKIEDCATVTAIKNRRQIRVRSCKRHHQYTLEEIIDNHLFLNEIRTKSVAGNNVLVLLIIFMAVIIADLVSMSSVENKMDVASLGSVDKRMNCSFNIHLRWPCLAGNVGEVGKDGNVFLLELEFVLKEGMNSVDVYLRTFPKLMLRIRMIFFLDVADADEEGFS